MTPGLWKHKWWPIQFFLLLFFWHGICGHQALQPSPCGPAIVPPSPNQYGRQQDCGLKCSMGFFQQASTHRHEILCQQPTSQHEFAYAQEASTLAFHRNTDCILPKKSVHVREIKGIRSSSVRQYGVVVKCQSHKCCATDNRPG
jgi:hypothetical protein